MYLFLIFLPVATRCIIFFASDYMNFDEVRVGEFCLFYQYKELCRPFLGYFFHVLVCEFVIGSELFFVFVSARSDIDEMPVCAKLRKWTEPVQSVWHHATKGFNDPF
jgi:hypothetical protein